MNKAGWKQEGRKDGKVDEIQKAKRKRAGGEVGDNRHPYVYKMEPCIPGNLPTIP